MRGGPSAAGTVSANWITQLNNAGLLAAQKNYRGDLTKEAGIAVALTLLCCSLFGQEQQTVATSTSVVVPFT